MFTPAIIQKISASIHSLVPEAKAILFGSRARGDARPDSDVDILVILPDNKYANHFSRWKLDIGDRMTDIELDHQVMISPLVVLKSIWESRKTPFTINVANEGIEI